MKRHRLADEKGQTTVEYTLVWAFMSMISVFMTIWLLKAMMNLVATLAIKVAVYLTGFP
jgi:Flp pilus assembly pilin Flp